MLTKNCLAEALENISGKKFPEGVCDRCTTTCELLNEFNNLYKCAVTFSGVIGSTNVTDKMTVTVKDGNGNVIEATDNKYLLKKGSYTYTATVEGGQDKTDVALSITKSDEQNGTKNVAITFTAA